MIILLTGEPHSGKTTVAEKFIERFQGDCRWVLMREVMSRGERVGFEAQTDTGSAHLIAHVNAVKSDAVIGSHRYHVDVGAIDRFFTDPLEQAVSNPPGVFVLDEIGNIQRLSPNFTPAVAAAFARNINLLALIRDDQPWTNRYRHHPYAACLAVTPATRDQLPDLLVTIFTNLPAITQLRPAQRETARTLTRRYARQGNLVLLGKLYANALRYVAEHRLRPAGPNAYTVAGDHGDHTVTTAPRSRCDCDLFNGRGRFTGHKGDCSHLMAARLVLAA